MPEDESHASSPVVPGSAVHHDSNCGNDQETNLNQVNTTPVKHNEKGKGPAKSSNEYLASSSSAVPQSLGDSIDSEAPSASKTTSSRSRSQP
jgi:hypothetical protein